MSDQLKTCPFCGADAMVCNQVAIGCSKCSAFSRASDWNRRAEPPIPQSVADQIVRQQEEIDRLRVALQSIADAEPLIQDGECFSIRYATDSTDVFHDKVDPLKLIDDMVQLATKALGDEE